MGKPKPVSDFGPQAVFDQLAFDKLIQFHGLKYWWSRALECPCRLNNTTDQWDPTCARCGGDGWLYVNPCAAQERHLPNRDYTEIQAVFSMVTSNQGDKFIEEFGSYDDGDAQLTVQNAMRVGWRDRFIGIEQEIAFTELLERGAGDVVPVGMTGRTRAEQQTAMRYEPNTINYIEDDDGAGNRTVYYEGTDWTLRDRIGDEPRKLVWQTGQGPPSGRIYTIHYVIHPVWIVDSAVYHVQNSRGPVSGLKGKNVLQTLPSTFKVKLDFLTPKRGT